MNEVAVTPIVSTVLPGISDMSLYSVLGLVVAALSFWLARYIWLREDITWVGRVCAVLSALFGFACLLAFSVFRSCASGQIRMGG